MLPSVVRMLLTTFLEEVAQHAPLAASQYRPVVDSPRPGSAPAPALAVARACPHRACSLRDGSKKRDCPPGFGEPHSRLL